MEPLGRSWSHFHFEPVHRSFPISDEKCETTCFCQLSKLFRVSVLRNRIGRFFQKFSIRKRDNPRSALRGEGRGSSPFWRNTSRSAWIRELVRRTDPSEQRAVQTAPRLASLAGVLAIPRHTFLNLGVRNLLFALLLGFAAASSPQCPSLRAMVASRMEEVATVPLGALRRDLKVRLPSCCSQPDIRTLSACRTMRIKHHLRRPPCT